jgi:hypothetical protein
MDKSWIKIVKYGFKKSPFCLAKNFGFKESPLPSPQKNMAFDR